MSQQSTSCESSDCADSEGEKTEDSGSPSSPIGGPIRAPYPDKLVLDYDDHSANVMLVSSDNFEFRVHDYYLKAASDFFRDMLKDGTKGGFVPLAVLSMRGFFPLEATSAQLHFFISRITGKGPRMQSPQTIAQKAPADVRRNGWELLWALFELNVIANKYRLTGVSEYLHRLIACYANQNPPATLAYACQSQPINGEIAIAALKAFKNEMPQWMNCFESATHASKPSRDYCSPRPTNFRKDSVNTIGADAFRAYTFAVNCWSSYTRGKGWVHDWDSIAATFAERLNLPCDAQQWLLREDKLKH